MAALGLRPMFFERRAEVMGNTFLPDVPFSSRAKRSHSIGRCSFHHAEPLHDSLGDAGSLRTSRSGRMSSEAASYVPLAQEQKTVLALFDALSLTQPPDDQSTSASSGSARSGNEDESERSCSPCGAQVLDTDFTQHQLAMEGEGMAMDSDGSAPLMGYLLQPVQPELEECAFAGDYVDYGDYAEYGFPYEHAQFSEAPQFSEVAQFGDSAQFGDAGQFGEVVQFSEASQFTDGAQFTDGTQFGEVAHFGDSAQVAPWVWNEEGDWSGHAFAEGDWRTHGF